MTFNFYQRLAWRTLGNGHQRPKSRHYLMLGLTEEMGELAQRYKRFMSRNRDQLTTADRGQLRLDLGDVLWYLSALAREADISLESVAVGNLRKLDLLSD